MCLSRTARRARALVLSPIIQLTLLKLCILFLETESSSDTEPHRRLDPSYRPPPIWGCENGLPMGSFHIVVATYAPEPSALIPWIWNLGLSGAHIWIYHRLPSFDARLLHATSTLATFEPYPCNSRVTLQALLPNKGREAAVYLTHIVTHFENLPLGLALVHDHGPAARHSLCGPFFRRVRGYYAGIREQRRSRRDGGGWVPSGSSTSGGVRHSDGGDGAGSRNGTAGAAAMAAAADVLQEQQMHQEQQQNQLRRQRSMMATAGSGGFGTGNGSGQAGRGKMGAAAAGSGGRWKAYSRTTESVAVRRMLAKFAGRVVSLSSGCQENWLKGCCAQLLCAEDGADIDLAAAAAATEYDTLIGGAAASDGVGTGSNGGASSLVGGTWRGTGGSVTLTGSDTTDSSNDQGNTTNITAMRQGRRHLSTASDVTAGGVRVVGSSGGNVGGYGEAAGSSGSVAAPAAEDGDGAGEADAARLAAARVARGRCPFKTSRCLANASHLSVPLRAGMGRGGQRWVYMHGAGGLYDTRYENLVVLHNESPEAAAAALTGGGISNAGFGPLSLVRYAGADAVETARLATSASRSLDYPPTGPDAPSRTPQETYNQLNRILAEHDFATRRTPGSFKSCCASLLLRPVHIRRWPKSLYEQILSYTLDEQNTYHASLAVSHHGWALWAGTDSGPDDLLRYFEVDLALLNMRGCPGWRMVVKD